MIERLYDLMGIPDNCHLGRRVYKKHFYDRIHMNATDKKAFSEDIALITWKYTLKPNTIAIAPYNDGVHEYVEVVFLQVDVISTKRVRHIANIIHKAIPYPVFLVFAYYGTEAVELPSCTELAISVAPKRVSQSGVDALVVEEVLVTSWIDLEQMSLINRSFLDSMRLVSLPNNHFYAFYLSLTDRIRSLEWAERTGHLLIATTEERRLHQREQMGKYCELEAELAKLKAAMKREAQFNRQVELNMRIVQLQAEMRHLTEGGVCFEKA